MKTGQNLGPYEVLSRIGAGGMGEVYLGRDTKLDRDVALKVLPDAFARDKERVARFRREAKVLASLNHPGIGAIYGFEESDGECCLVLEYVKGETLAARLKRGPIAMDEALDVARQMAEALEGAHEKGVIHRDLKPSNVMLRPDGTVKVLDFGLAKAMADGTDMSEADRANSPTITANYTRPGVVLGTAAYMSPEQARGRSLDKRTDIWSFGVVLFECFSGRRPFEGDTVSDLVARILEREPDWTALPAATPPLIQLLLRRCLAKDPKRRLRDIGDARVDIETALDDPTASGLLLAHGALATGSKRRWRQTAPFAGLLAIAALIGGGIGWSVRRPEPIAETPVLRFAVDIPAPYSLSREEDVSALSLNPPGTMLAFVAGAEGKRHIFIHDLSDGKARILPGTEGAEAPFFSPDGRWLGFFARGKLMKVSMSGGPPLVVCNATGNEGAWLEGGTIALTTKNGKKILLVDDAGGTPQVLTVAGATTRTVDGAQLLLGFCDIEAVPGADYLLAGVWDGFTIQEYATVSVSLTDGTVRPVMQNAIDARYVPPGYLVSLRESSLLAAPFDAERGVVTGEAFQVIDGILSSMWAEDGQFATSVSGTLVYVAGGRLGPGRRLIRVDSSGKSEPLMNGTDAVVGGIRISPDGREVAVVTLRRRMELWTFSLDRRSLTLVNNIGETWRPTWRPDGKALVFQQMAPEQASQIVLKPTDVASPAEPVPIGKSGDIAPSSFSPDGSLLLLTDWLASGGGDVLLHHWGQDGATEVLLGTPAREQNAMFAPDGEHFAYVSNETGRDEVFVKTLSVSGPKWQVSREGGDSPVWSRDGKNLYFLDQKAVMHRAPIQLDPAFQVSSPERLFDTTTVATTDLWGVYDVLPDGDFVMVEPAEWEKKPVRIHVVTNWATTLGKDSRP